MTAEAIHIRPMNGNDLEEADNIMRLAFGTFLGLPEPIRFMGDADYVKTRFNADPLAALVAITKDNRIVGVVMIKTIVSQDSFDKKSVIQISYFNCIKRSLYLKVIYLLLEKYHNDRRFDNIQVFLPTFLDLRKFLSFESIDYSDQFYLYTKKLRNIRHNL